MMLTIFSILIYTISLTLYKTMAVTVHNWYSNIELTSLIYFCNHGRCYEYPVGNTDAGVMMKRDFRFDLNQDECGGILMYEVQRKGNIRFDYRFSIDTISAKAIEEASKMTRLLVIWKIERFGKSKVNIMLVEYDNKLVLDEDKLARLYDKVNDIPSGHNPSKLLMCDNTMLAATHKVVREAGLELKITISKGVRDLDTIRSMWIGLERQVLSLTIIYFC
jgi:hypothetical protein